MSPTPLAAWLLGACAASALIVPDWMAIVAFGIVAVATGVDAWMVRKAPQVHRTVPDVLSRGVPAELTVGSADSRSLRIRQPTNADLLLVPEEDDGELDADIVATRRGRHVLPGPATRSVGPLRLGAWYHRSTDAGEVLVYPDMPAAFRLAMDVRYGRFREEGRRSRGPLGLGTELESIRDYQPDDDIRQVNWRATARVGRPMSNQYRVEQDREVICLVDAGRLMAAPIGDRTRMDAAVDAVAAMAAVADEVGDRVGVVAFTDRVIRSLGPRRANGRAVVRAVFDLEAEPVDSNYELAFRRVTGAKRAFVLILTDLLDEGAAAPLIDAMAILARHHSVAVAAVRDDGIDRAATAPPESGADAYRMAVALDVLESRRLVTTTLARFGAEVIEAPLEEFSSQCVGAYLRSRRRGRL